MHSHIHLPHSFLRAAYSGQFKDVLGSRCLPWCSCCLHQTSLYLSTEIICCSLLEEFVSFFKKQRRKHCVQVMRYQKDEVHTSQRGRGGGSTCHLKSPNSIERCFVFVSLVLIMISFPGTVPESLPCSMNNLLGLFSERRVFLRRYGKEVMSGQKKNVWSTHTHSIGLFPPVHHNEAHTFRPIF